MIGATVARKLAALALHGPAKAGAVRKKPRLAGAFCEEATGGDRSDFAFSPFTVATALQLHPRKLQQITAGWSAILVYIVQGKPREAEGIVKVVRDSRDEALQTAKEFLDRGLPFVTIIGDGHVYTVEEFALTITSDKTPLSDQNPS